MNFSQFVFSSYARSKEFNKDDFYDYMSDDFDLDNTVEDENWWKSKLDYYLAYINGELF